MLKKIIFFIISLNILLATQDTYINMDKVIPNMNMLYRVVDPLDALPIKRTHIYRKNKLIFHKSKTFCLATIDSTWNDDFINSVNKLRKSDIHPEC